MNSRVKFAVGVLAVLGIVAAVWCLSWPPTKSTGSAVDTVSEGEVSRVPAREATQPSTGSAPHLSHNAAVELPPLDAPLALTITTLEEQVAAGSANAACRLASEFTNCIRADQSLGQVDAYQLRQQAVSSLLEKTGGDTEVELRPVRQELLESTARCEGVELAEPARIAQLWRAAALAGHGPSMRNYALGHGFAGGSLLDNLDSFTRYKAEAPQIALNAAKQGDVAVLLALAAAYTPRAHSVSPTLLAQAVGVDVTEALALLTYAKRAAPNTGGDAAYVHESIDMQLAELQVLASSEQKVEAERRANEMMATWQRPRVESVGSLAAVRRGSLPAISMEACGI